MNDMVLVESRSVNNVLVDGFYGDEEAWFSRRQVGEALKYDDPNDAIAKIHKRHKERLDEFSRVVSLSTPSGKQEAYIYSLEGVLEICRWSRQPKADMVMDALYGMAKSVMRKGYFSLMSDEELYRVLGERLQARQELVLRTYTVIEPSTIKTSIPLCTVSEERLCKA